MNLPVHLGGHNWVTQMDEGVLDYLTGLYAPKSFLDIGCGPGGMLKAASDRGMRAVGIDGDHTLDFAGLDVRIHDFTKGPVPLGDERFDLGWCVEVLEHIEERHVANLKPAFEACDRVWLTHAVPGQVGYHHVNCQTSEYWRDKFLKWGWIVSKAESRAIRARSSMGEDYGRLTGMLLHRVQS